MRTARTHSRTRVSYVESSDPRWRGTEPEIAREEAVVLKRLLAERAIERFVIVTSAVHMGRSLATFAVAGLHPVPSASPIYQDGTDRPFPLAPNEVSLEIGNAVVYEWCARAYYWWNGWT